MNTYDFNEFSYLILVTIAVLCIPQLRQALIPKEQSSRSEPTPVQKNALGRFTLFDTIRGIAMTAVILIHVLYIAYQLPIIVHTIPDIVLDALNTSLRFALPIFFITSGLLLKPVPRTYAKYSTFIWNRCVAILPPYILMTGVLAWMQQATLPEFATMLLTGSGAVPLYFIPVLLQLYLLYPFIAPYATKRWFVFAALLCSVGAELYFHTWEVFGITTAFRYIFFFVWGIYMRAQFLNGTFPRTPLPWLGMILVCIGVYWYFPGHFFNTRLIYGTAMFSLLYIAWTTPQIQSYCTSWLTTIGRHSLWIYLTHFTLMTATLPYLYINLSTTLSASLMLGTLAATSLVISIVGGIACQYLYTAATQTVQRLLFAQDVRT